MILLDNEIKDLLLELIQDVKGLKDGQERLEEDVKDLKDGQEEFKKEVYKKFNILGQDVKEIKDKVSILVDFEKNTSLVHEKLDTKLKSIDNGIKVLAQEDFRLKTDILDVKEDLKVIKGGKH